MKIAITVVCTALVLSGIIFIPHAFAENVPEWVKNTAGWWADGIISETEFVNAIEFLVKESIIQVNVSQASETSQSVPEWVKNTAGWWADDIISDDDFVNSLQYLIKVGIIVVPQAETTLKIPGYPDWLVNNPSWQTAREATNSDFTNFDISYVDQSISKCSECVESINNHGFRGDDFSKENPDNTFRIFAVGGSTTFGEGVSDDETWPFLLQQKFDKTQLGVNIQVINAGVQASHSGLELELIEQKIINFEPDLIIMYDGWNDSNNLTVQETIQNWSEVCKLGNENGFDALITIQPLPGSGKRVLTSNELLNYKIYTSMFVTGDLIKLRHDKIAKLVNYLDELDELCTKTADLSTIFDYVFEPIYWDLGHTNNIGNKIIAENMFRMALPIILDNDDVLLAKINTKTEFQNSPCPSCKSSVYAAWSDLSGKNFDSLKLKNSIFYNADLTGSSFENTDLTGSDFRLANLKNVNFNNANLENTKFHYANFDNLDISQKPLSDVDLRYTDLSAANLVNVDLSEKDLYFANLSGQDLSGHNLTNTMLSSANLSNAKLPDNGLSGKTLTSIILNGADLSGKDLSNSDFSHSKLDGANMENADLTESMFVEVDFTKIKNKSLAGANLVNTSFAYSNLSGVDLSGTFLQLTNFWHTDLSGQDFTVADIVVGGIAFVDTDLSNSNFEGVDLSPNDIYAKVFENKAHLYNLSDVDLIENLFGEFVNIRMTSKEVRGNDLTVTFVIYNNFQMANLENANFKNADLLGVVLKSANLTNADLSEADLTWAGLPNANLSGADLSNANLSGADLSNANLSGADLSNADLNGANLSGADLNGAYLQGANLSGVDLYGADLDGAAYDNDTILDCVGHDICEAN